MKRRLSRFYAFMMILCLALPLLAGFAPPVVAKAASPSLNETSKKIYLGTTFQLEIQNVDMDEVKSVSWKANRKSIAKVDQNGVVTPVSVGTTAIKCTLTYTNGEKQILSCNAVVRERRPATGVKITNATNAMNAYSVYVGNILSLKKTVTPSNTTDTAYYVSYDENIATVSTSGVVTARSEGVTVVEVRYGMDKEDAMRADNPAVAKAYLYITKKPTPTPTPTPSPTPTPTPTPVVGPKVTSVKLVGSKELEVNFSTPVRKDSLISGSKLASSTILIGKEEASLDCGTLTPTLSNDRMKLTLTATGTFSGIYSIVVSSKLRSDDGTAFEQYAEVLTLRDTAGPVYVDTTVDYTGRRCSINFNEPLDISGIAVRGIEGTNDQNLRNWLSMPANYKLSDDKKSIIVDLNGRTYETQLSVTVILANIRDIAGNYTSNLLQNVTVRTDMSSKPLANIVSAERVSRSQIKVTFDNAIYSYAGGTARYGDLNTVSGRVSTEDPTVVMYDIPATFQTRTGYLTVQFNGWQSYNAVSKQNVPVDRSIDFTLDSTPPKIVKAEISNVTNNNTLVSKLVLTYNKEISYASNSPMPMVRMIDSYGNVSSFTPIAISTDVKDCVVTYLFGENALLQGTNFTFAFSAGMVKDKFDNSSATDQVSVVKSNAVTTNGWQMPVATQDTQNRNVIYLTFSTRLDIASAQNTQNYYLTGRTTYPIYPTSASIYSQSATESKVALTFSTGTFSGQGNSYELVINGVRDFNGVYSPISNMHVVFTATEVSYNFPTIIAGSIRRNGAGIEFMMSEEVTGTIQVVATDPVTKASVSGKGYTGSGTSVYIIFETALSQSNENVYFTITQNELYSRSSGNKAMLDQAYYAVPVS